MEVSIFPCFCRIDSQILMPAVQTGVLVSLHEKSGLINILQIKLKYCTNKRLLRYGYQKQK